LVVIKKIIKNDSNNLNNYYKKRDDTIKLCKEVEECSNNTSINSTNSTNSINIININDQKIEIKKEIIHRFYNIHKIKILNDKKRNTLS
jgi:hypothetical protein